MNMSRKSEYGLDEVGLKHRGELVSNFGMLLSHYHSMKKVDRNSILTKYINKYGVRKLNSYWMSFKEFAQHHRVLTHQENLNFNAIQNFIKSHLHIGSDLPHNTTDLEPIASMLESLHERISILEARIPTR